ncbi:MAG TPA: hypothetical protein VHC22_31025 [Pirellulales bacterium]|nr:hypothetical protein [Pirellulales bacterium]
MTNDPFAPVPPRPPARSNYLYVLIPLALLAGLVVLVAVGVGVFVVLQREGTFARPRPPRPQESLAEKRRANTEAFGKSAAAGDASPKEISEFAALLERISHIKTAEQAEECFDIDRLFQEVGAASSNQQLFRAPGTAKGFRKGFTERFADRGLLRNCVSSEVKRVNFQGGRDEAILFSQHRTAEGHGVKIRWWAARSQGKWKIYDFEDLEMGVRSSTNAAALMDAAGKQGFSPKQSEAVNAVGAATTFLVQREYDRAEQQILPTLDVPLPKALAAWRFAQLAIVQTSRNNWEQVIGFVDRAAAVNPDMPMLPMLRAQALNGLGRFDEAAVEARKYITELGGDDHGSFLLGTALTGMGKKDEAADAFREGLGDYADSVENLVGLAGVLSADDMEEVAERFEEFERPAARFQEVAGQLVAEENSAALAAVVARNRLLAPRDPHNDFYQGEMHWMLRQYDEAAEAFRKALPKMPPDERIGCQRALRNSLLSADKPIEAYEAMPDGNDTFLAICNHLVKNRDADGLDRLTKMHAERHPDDYWLPYFRGEVQMMREEYEQAAATFRPMLTAQLPDGARASYHDEYLAAEINAGHPLQGYQDVPDAEDAFLKTANRLLADRNPDDLEKLVALHAERQPDDLFLTYFGGEVPYLRGQPAEAAERFKPLLDKELPDGLREPCFKEYLRCMVDVGKSVDGYRAVPDAAFAFEFVADLLLEHWASADALEALIAAHTERMPEDPWLSYYRGRLLMLRYRYGEAAELLAPLIKQTPDERLQVELSEACRAALVYDGKPQEAYAISVDRAVGFERTAAYLADRRDAEKLAALLTTREADQPEDPALAYYQARMAGLSYDYRAVAGLLTPVVARIADGEQRDRVVNLLLNALYELGDTQAACQAVKPEEAFNSLASELANDGDADALEKLLAAYEPHAADDPRLSYFRGKIAQLRGQSDEATTAFAAWFKTTDENDVNSLQSYLKAMAAARRPLEAYNAAPDASVAFKSLASELIRCGDIDLLEALIDTHAQEHAEDPWLGYWRGRSLLLNGKEDEAMATYASLLHDPANAEVPGLLYSAWHEYLIVGKPLEAYMMASDAQAAFEYFGESLLQDRDLGRLRQLVAAHEPNHSEDSCLAWLKAELLSADGKYAEAIELLSPRLADSDDPWAYRSRMAYHTAVAKAGRAVDIYRAAEDKRGAFTGLAFALYEAGDAAGLQAIIDAHRELSPDDPWLGYYAAQQLRLAQHYDEADLAFAGALANPDMGSLRANLTSKRLEARYEAGQALSAYEDVGPRLATLDALVDLCEAKRDTTQLSQLITAHRERYPNDARLQVWELEVASWKGDDEGLLHSLDDRRTDVSRSFHHRLQELQVRTLVRLKRFDDARNVLDSRRRLQSTPLLRALVEATAGNVSAAIPALYECLRSGVDVATLYRDPDLGPVLRTETFAGFRERHPEKAAAEDADKAE